MFAVPALAMMLLACQRDESPPPPPARPVGKLEMVPAPGGEVAPFVAAEVARAKRDHKQLLVYEGATWCEPCQRFHHAAETGELDADFPDLRLLVFDSDRDDNDLARAGYDSAYVPLFAIPDDDGTASGRQMEGGSKGATGIRDIAPRLHALLDQTAPPSGGADARGQAPPVGGTLPQR